MGRLRVAVIGVGHLGKEHARIMASLPDVELVGVSDVNAEQVQAVARRCNTQAFTEYWPLLNLVDAVSIAVPTNRHYEVAAEFLRRGIPVMVEKPLAPTLEQAQELVELSRQHNAILQVGHIERFNPAFVDLQTRQIQPKFVEGHRLGSFTGRSLDIGVVLDLMIHDLDLLLTLVGSNVQSVEAVGVSLFGGHEDIANARLTFENGCVANLTASRVSMTPQRKMRIFSPEGYVSIDFGKRHATIIQPSEKARREGIDLRRLDFNMITALKEGLFGQFLQIQDIDMPQVDQLTCELGDFVQCVRTGRQPRVNGEDGLKAIELATRILDKIKTHQWEGIAAGPVGPAQHPPPLGPLFTLEEAA